MSPRNPNEVLQPDERKEVAGSGEKRVCDEAVGESALPGPKRRKKESWDEERSGRDDDDVLREIGGCQGKVSVGPVTLRDENESHGWDGQGVETGEDSGDECDGERSNSDKVKEDENYYEKRDLDESSEDDQYTARTALMEREEELDEMERQEQRVQMKRQLELIKLCRERAKARVQEATFAVFPKKTWASNLTSVRHAATWYQLRFTTSNPDSGVESSITT
ncbi:hypothetical protein B0J14DRAFT_579624 [Halenospora varia]|nr:hypothetical protein B0J14DRAFT_579624 [Halenospora varia]